MKTIEELKREYRKLDCNELDLVYIIPDPDVRWVEPTDPNNLEYREYRASIAVMAERGYF